MIDATMLEGPDVPGRETQAVEEFWPPAPKSVEDTGLPGDFLVEHLLKTLFLAGPSTVPELGDSLGCGHALTEELTNVLKVEQLIEAVDVRGYSEWGIRYRVTAKGTDYAENALDRSRYTGIVPVSLDDYSAMAVRQSLRRNPPSQDAVDRAFEAFVLPPDVQENLALAFHSGRPMLIFGASGNGKTSVVEAYAGTFAGAVLFPYALYVAGHVIRIYDPIKHDLLPIDRPADDERAFSLLRSDHALGDFDRRWVKIRRPTIFVGGELELSDLNLTCDPVTRQYQAPAHLKAQDGIFLIDDFGRQRARPEEVLNRWIVPMERGSDNLTLETGEIFTIPFEMALLFSSNLRLTDLADEAFLRRIPYKIHLPAPDRVLFGDLTRMWCDRLNLGYTEAGVDYLCRRLFGDPDVVPSGTQPRDLAKIILDYTRFKGVEPVLAPEHIDKAFAIYFVRERPTRGG